MRARFPHPHPTPTLSLTLTHPFKIPACFKHCNTLKSTWRSLTVDGVTLEEAVTSWFFGEGGVKTWLEDTCEGWNCGPGCA